MDERAFDLQSEIGRIETRITKPHAHGSNILTQLRNFNRLSTAQQQSLPGIVYAYQEWFEANDNWRGYMPEIIRQRVEALNRYKDFIESAPLTP